jgi:hypothetical protein
MSFDRLMYFHEWLSFANMHLSDCIVLPYNGVKALPPTLNYNGLYISAVDEVKL